MSAKRTGEWVEQPNTGPGRPQHRKGGAASQEVGARKDCHDRSDRLSGWIWPRVSVADAAEVLNMGKVVLGTGAMAYGRRMLHGTRRHLA